MTDDKYKYVEVRYKARTVIPGTIDHPPLEPGIFQILEPQRNAIVIEFVDGSPVISLDLKDESEKKKLEEEAHRIYNFLRGKNNE